MSGNASRWSAARDHREGYLPALSGALAKHLTLRMPHRPARVAVVGEFNSGKTTLVNALLGTPLLPTGFTTHTPCPVTIEYAARPSASAACARRSRRMVDLCQLDGGSLADVRRVHIGSPLPRLKLLRIVDTPGLGRDDGSDEATIVQACRGADIVVWCTPSMQAWKASEQHAWLNLPRRLQQRGVLAVTFVDAIASLHDRHRLQARLHAEAGPHFGEITLAPATAILARVLASTHSARGYGHAVAASVMPDHASAELA